MSTRDEKLSIAALFAFRRANKAILRREGEVIKAHGLTIPQFGAMERIYSLGPMRIQDIIEATLSTSGNMTVVIKNLERDGYVFRESHPGDGRCSLIDLTDKGRQLIEDILPEQYELIDEILSPLSDADKKELIYILKKLYKQDGDK